MKTGHEVEVELVASLDEEKAGGAGFFFQVMDEGQKVCRVGSNEWWAGEPPTVKANQLKYDKRPGRGNGKD